jgi:Beta-fructosidases (levanase/invertase)
MNNSFKILIFFLVIGTQILPLNAQYNEKYRPQFHLSPKASSMADPKGLFIYDGKYHIFWFGQWEHAISNDLIHWQELPKPMKGAPSQFSYFSGSVAVDKNNTAGFGNNSIIAVYTRHFPGDSLPETQAISISKDGGMTFQYYDKNPVLDINKKSFRDPQVFWHEPTKKWKMVVALSDAHQIPIYESGNLKDWNYCSTFGELGATSASWECPDLFELPVIGTKEKKWVMMIGRGPNRVEYFVGDFDGKTFKPDRQLFDYLKYGKGLKGIVYDDFETDSQSNWKVEGDAFNRSSGSADAIDYLGNGYAGNLSKNTATGRMKSNNFRINNKAINFLIAGGQSADSLCIRLVVDGRVCRTATGDNTRTFRWRGWDVQDLKNKEAHLEIIDLSNNDRNGSIAVDHIMFADYLLNHQAEHALWLDYGDDFYATRTYRNYDAKKKMGDSVILLSWMGNWKYARILPPSWGGTGFQTVPRALELKKFPEGLRLIQKPIAALKQLRKNAVQINNRTIKGTGSIQEFKPAKNTYEIEAVFNTNSSSVFGFNLLVGEGRKLVLTYDPNTSILCLDRTNCTDYTSNADFTKRFATKMFAPVKPEGNQLRLHLFIDESSIEVFTNQGKEVMSAVTYSSPSQTGIELFSEKGTTKLVSFNAWELSSIWDKSK